MSSDQIIQKQWRRDPPGFNYLSDRSTRARFQLYVSSFCFWIFVCFFRGRGRPLWVRVAGGVCGWDHGGWQASGGPRREYNLCLPPVGGIRSRVGSRSGPGGINRTYYIFFFNVSPLYNRHIIVRNTVLYCTEAMPRYTTKSNRSDVKRRNERNQEHTLENTQDNTQTCKLVGRQGGDGEPKKQNPPTRRATGIQL